MKDIRKMAAQAVLKSMMQNSDKEKFKKWGLGEKPKIASIEIETVGGKKMDEEGEPEELSEDELEMMLEAFKKMRK